MGWVIAAIVAVVIFVFVVGVLAINKGMDDHK